ncbi:MAG: DUF4258 domain-containing protein [Ignavibacteria bacterium]
MSPIIFIEHALDRMKERGVSEYEVRKTINSGSSRPAKQGRIKFEKIFAVTDPEKKKKYSKKKVVVIAQITGKDIDVISVYPEFY